MLTSDRRRWSGSNLQEQRAQLPLMQRARLSELEQDGWQLRCIRTDPLQVVVSSRKNRLAVLLPDGRLVDAMGVALRYR